MDKYNKFCNDLYLYFSERIELDGTHYLIVSGPQFCPNPSGMMSEEIYDFLKDEQVMEDHYEVTVVKPGSLFADVFYVNDGGGYLVVVHATRFLLKLRENENKDFFADFEEHQILDSYDMSMGIDRFRYEFMRTIESQKMTVYDWFEVHSHDITGPCIFCDSTGTEIQVSSTDFKNCYVDGYFKDPKGEQNIIYVQIEQKK